MIESLSQVSVNKAGFTCAITHFTSSLVQATWVLVVKGVDMDSNQSQSSILLFKI